MKYRPEIDGLRAIAVVPVILFHAGFESFRAEYLGVDIFFVISGYLITTILIDDISNDRFSIVNFYERRARRIIPALFFVMLACIPFAWMWMFPAQMKGFTDSVMAVSFFVSNILFWFESGYFEAASELKPLLHTWSLAVEEQYYILFPIILVLIWRFGQSLVFWIIAVFALTSYTLGEWGWRADESARFYLAPARAWELLAGSLVAIFSHQNGSKSSNLLSALGFIAIVSVIFAGNKNASFPSLDALIIVAGVVLVILYAGPGTLVAKALGVKPLVGIGLISYSAYLWHQPLFAFAKIRLMEKPSDFLMLCLSLSSLVLAYGSWRFIEAPFRDRQKVSRKSIFRFSLLGTVVFVAFGISGHNSKGFETRMPDSVAAIQTEGKAASPKCLRGQFDECKFGATDEPHEIVLIGDSHAGRYALGLKDIFQAGNASFYAFVAPWCAPLLDCIATVNINNHECSPNMTETLIDVSQDEKIKVVILAAEWSNYTTGYRHESKHTAYSFADGQNFSAKGNAAQFKMSMKATLELLLDRGKKVVLIDPTPEYDYHVTNTLAKSALYTGVPQTKAISFDDYFERNREFFNAISGLTHPMLIKISVANMLCDSENCKPYNADGLPLYSDDNHLSILGLNRVAKHIYQAAKP